MIRLTFLIVVCTLCFALSSDASWSEEKTARELVFFAALVNDWQQTLVISDTPWKREANGILGPKPSRTEVHLYFAGCALGHAAVSYFLPDKYAKIWQDVWIGVQSMVSDKNVKLGHVEEVSVGYRLTHTIKF